LQLAMITVLLGFRGKVPVQRGLEQLAECRRDVNLLFAVATTGLDERHAYVGIGGQAMGEDATGRAGADDHVVVHQRTSIAVGPTVPEPTLVATGSQNAELAPPQGRPPPATLHPVA